MVHQLGTIEVADLGGGRGCSMAYGHTKRWGTGGGMLMAGFFSVYKWLVWNSVYDSMEYEWIFHSNDGDSLYNKDAFMIFYGHLVKFHISYDLFTPSDKMVCGWRLEPVTYITMYIVLRKYFFKIICSNSEARISYKCPCQNLN